MNNLDYLYNPDAAKDRFGKNYFVDKKLHFRIIERGTILPHKDMRVNGKGTWGFGGIVDERGEFVKSSFVVSGVGSAYTPSEDIKHSPATVIYLGLFYPVWGHVITDNIRRLWFLKSEVFKKYFSNCPIVYVNWGGGYGAVQLKNFQRLLEILEVDFEKIQPVIQPTQFENIILPDESFFSDADGQRKFTDAYRETIDRVRNFALKNQTPSAKKIYYFYGSRQFGEERIAQYFRSKGYEIVSPEKLTLDEQLNLLINAESFASTIGSCSHNSVFLRDGTEVILIPRAAERFTGYLPSINRVHALNINYVDSSLSIFNVRHGPYCFIISEQLKKFFGDEFTGYSDDDFKTFLNYTKLCIEGGLKFSHDAEKYYGETLQKFLSQLKQRRDLLTAYGVSLS